MKELECKCGGTLRKTDNRFICENCDTMYLISADDKGELFAYQPVEKKHIQAGQIATKASTIAVKDVVVREIRLDEDIEGQLARESMDLDKRSRIGLIEGYLATNDWEKVNEHVNGLLREDKDCSEAKWYGWMSEKKAATNQQMLAKLTNLNQAESIRLDQLLQTASPTFARRIVNLFFDGAYANDNMCYYALSAVLPYARNEVVNSPAEFARKVSDAYDRVISGAYEKAFNFLLENTLQPEDVDLYITYLIRFSGSCSTQTSLEYLERILAVDPGNLEVHKKLVSREIQCDVPCKKTIAHVERLVSYSENADGDVRKLLEMLAQMQQTTVNQSEIMWELLGYHSEAPQGMKDLILDYGFVLLESKLWLRARDFFNLVLSFDIRCGKAYWGLCLVQMQARNAKDAVGKKEPIKSFSAYDKALAVFHANGDQQSVTYLRGLSEEQKSKKKNRKNAIIFGAAAIAVILVLVLCSNLIKNAKYSPDRVELSLYDIEHVQEPVSEMKLKIVNGCKEDLTGLYMTIRFYDGENTLLSTTTLNLNGYMEPKDESNLTINLHSDVIYDLYDYSFEELKVTIAINEISFGEHVDDLGEGKERVLKEAEAPDQEYLQNLKNIVNRAYSILDEADPEVSDMEEAALEFAKALDADWEAIIRNKTILQMMYDKASDYQKNGEYEKGYYAFAVLSSADYKDSADRTHECAVQLYS